MRFPRQPVFCCLFALWGSFAATAQTWDKPAQELADKILAHALSRTAISFTVKNLSSLSTARAAEMRHAIESQLRNRGVQFVSSEQAVEEFRITLSENSQGYLWVAEIGHGNSWEVLMVPVAGPVSERSAAAVVLRRTSWLAQAQPILDVAGDQRSALLVLDSQKISFYRWNGSWQLQQSFPIAHERAWPRDLRGRLVSLPNGSFTAYLPGIHCKGAMQPQFTWKCEENDDPWPLTFDPPVNAFFGARNFFNGTVVPAISTEGKLPPFFSATVVPHASVWVFALADGTTRFVDTSGELQAITGWGSDVVGLRSPCGSEGHVLASHAGDDGVPDSLQAYDIAGREVVETGLPMEFSGPITALWAAPDAGSATAVAHNLKSGLYEAFTVSLSCER